MTALKPQNPEIFRAVEPDNDHPAPLWQKLAWFIGIAIASGAVVAVVTYALRGLLFL